MPDLAALWSFQKRAMTMPIKMANTGPPTTWNRCPSSQAGTAITRQARIPRAFFLTNSMICVPFSLVYSRCIISRRRGFVKEGGSKKKRYSPQRSISYP